MKKNHEERLLKLWKIRQIQEGHDVSGVHSLKEAERYFEKEVDESVDETVSVDESVNVPGSAIIEEVALEDMTKAELIAYAKASGLKVDSSMKKAEIIEIIEGM